MRQEAQFPLFDEIEEWELDNAIGRADGLPRPAITIATEYWDHTGMSLNIGWLLLADDLD